MKLQTKRRNTNIWYPKASDLPLVSIPEEVRSHIRKRLAPWLRSLKHAGHGGRLGVAPGTCWQVAQGLVMTARDPGVKYVEGVWIRPYQLEEGEKPAPHAWASVDGHRVDLIGEFYSWRCGDDEWLYEPLKEYNWEQLLELEEYFTPGRACDISSFLLWLGKGRPRYKPDDGEGDLFDQFWEEIDVDRYADFVFKPAIDRLMARKSTDGIGGLQCE